VKWMQTVESRESVKLWIVRIADIVPYHSSVPGYRISIQSPYE
jgi:hypothetical protein